MEINYPMGVVATVLMVICLYGTTYAVISLNVGWRFGYWLTSSCFGAVMILLSVIWLQNPVGPLGRHADWIPMDAAESVTSAAYGDQTFTTPGQYPSGPWQLEEGEDGQRSAEFSSAISSCLAADPEGLPPTQQAACAAAQALMPTAEEIPILDGAAVAVLPRVDDIRFATEDALLAQATVVPVTSDPRITDDPDGVALTDPFQIVAVLDEGDRRIPALNSLFIFLLYTGFHLWGLNRAEKRKLSPAAT
jgi:hypothetical protein